MTNRAVLLDTCALIDLMGRRALGSTALARIREAEAGRGVLVSPISAWEVGLLSRARGQRPAVVFQPDAMTWFNDAMALPGVRSTPLTPEIAIGSASLPGSSHNDPADRLLIATARDLAVDIVTSDRLILAYGAAGHVGVVAC